MHHKARHSSKGFALASAMLIVLLLAGISAGTMYLVNTEVRLVVTDMEGAQAFYGAEAGMEKMMADLSLLYSAILALTVSDIEGLAATDLQPVIANISYPEYTFEIPNNSGVPIVETRTITSGPNEGLIAYITELTLSVTALAPTASEVKMERDIEMALIPVFQFGLFSETDLSYFSGPALTSPVVSTPTETSFWLPPLPPGWSSTTKSPPSGMSFGLSWPMGWARWLPEGPTRL